MFPHPKPDFRAEITFLTTEQGGRVGPVKSGYRPSHNFGLPNGEINDAAHENIGQEWVPMGTTVDALLQLLNPERQAARFYPGFEFTVQEAMKVVGHGRIIEILNPLLRRDQE
jgi:translation elongation factor EF-Tu-like GTPase